VQPLSIFSSERPQRNHVSSSTQSFDQAEIHCYRVDEEIGATLSVYHQFSVTQMLVVLPIEKYISTMPHTRCRLELELLAVKPEGLNPICLGKSLPEYGLALPAWNLHHRKHTVSSVSIFQDSRCA